ncbi:hypothetical protein Rsub_00755 [Raphidocelis subcapitata]|uniref:Cystatin domain-containing protein n=1 Tax=Raphidocelis subcapitata TaxID=307507 RepID=A0A2V0NR61_9CHLO|nr:hypothetical protein Rsub_00755 [Raphidocelis subcapitata]|eukprot:GBF88043.1 hypothetical protein Rsub_00755 [Raphidocelis subcapitata]
MATCKAALLAALLAACFAAAAAAPPAAQALFACNPSAATLPGGLSCRTPDAAARAAAEFALKQLNSQKNAVPGQPATLSGIAFYASQVVAGTNHYLQLNLKDAKGQPLTVQAVVYEKLPAYGGGMELSKFVVLPPGPGPVAGPVAGPSAALAAPAAAKPLFACPSQALLGGLSCKAPDSSARAAADFAVKALNARNAVAGGPVSLAGQNAVSKFATQVVAGSNYYLELNLKDAKGQPLTVQAVVYEKLPAYGGGMELSKFVVL